MRALVIGRFQPFHNGHIAMINEVPNSELIFAIGSAYEALSFENPFTAGERYEMIHAALNEIEGLHFFIVPVPDIHRHGVYGKHVVDMVPSFDVVLSNNPVIREIFSREKYEVRNTPMFNREHYQGSVIRHLMADGKLWEHLVPKKVAEFIKKIDGDCRVKRLASKEI